MDPDILSVFGLYHQTKELLMKGNQILQRCAFVPGDTKTVCVFLLSLVRLAIAEGRCEDSDSEDFTPKVDFLF